MCAPVTDTPQTATDAPARGALHDKISLHAKYVTPVLFTLAILMSAGLLFFVQPLLTRMVTPMIGGAAGVWTTATLFFQCVMIGGYLYAHLLTRLPRIRHQIGLHLLLWLVATTFLPMEVAADWVADTGAAIQTQTLILYGVTVGVPFFFLSSNAPLIQTWYGRTRGQSSHDPYFLYGASNIGSLIALLSFPLIAEPFFGIHSISIAWSAGFIGLGALLFISAFWTTKDHPDAKTVLKIRNQKSDMRVLIRWGAIAFVPSSLMLALTTKITTDFGSFPLLWVIPLALYLITYVIGFQSKALLSDRTMIWLYPCAIGVLAVTGMTGFLGSLTLEIAGIMALAFTVVSLHLHRRLYKLRPDPSRLTVFYLTISIGGAAGGFFNAILAPGVMDGMYEFSLTLLAAAAVLLLRLDGEAQKSRPVPAVLMVCVLLSLIMLDGSQLSVIATSYNLTIAVLIGCALLAFVELRSIGVILITAVTATTILAQDYGDSIYTSRNFFGMHRIMDDGKMRAYINGTTLHGGQFSDTRTKPEPIYYYRKDGPLGEIARSDVWQNAERVGLVGLGIGSMTAYRIPGQLMDVFEIDPAVISIAKDPKLFNFLSSYGAGLQIHVGDGRIQLEKKEADYGVLLIDAYSSDSVPMHLSTVEAMQSFMNDVSDDGILVYHISNRYFDLSAPLGAAATHLGYKAFYSYDIPSEKLGAGLDTPIIALAVVHKDAVPELFSRPETSWKELQVDPGQAWTDDKSSPFTALK